METKKVFELHAEHTEWLKKLDFYADEIKIMKGRVEEIAAKNTAQDVLKNVEHFQNQLIIQKNNLDELKHSINDHEQYLQNRLKENSVAADLHKSNDHPKMRDNFNWFEKNFNELRAEHNVFLSKWM